MFFKQSPYEVTKNHICKSKSSLRTAQIRSNHLVVHSPKSCVHRHSNTSCRPGTGGRVGGRGATSGERRPNTNTKAKRSSCFGQISPIAKTPRNLSLTTLATPLTAAKRIDVCPRAHLATPAAERIATLTLVTSTNTPPEVVPPRRGRQIANEVEATDGSNSARYYPTRLSCNPSSRVNCNDESLKAYLAPTGLVSEPRGDLTCTGRGVEEPWKLYVLYEPECVGG